MSVVVSAASRAALSLAVTGYSGLSLSHSLGTSTVKERLLPIYSSQLGGRDIGSRHRIMSLAKVCELSLKNKTEFI